jgi:predicted DsbA family dithiol-disulfide isomerase
MGFKEIIQSFGERNKQKKEMFKQAEAQLRIQKLLEDRQKSSNERELEKFMKEEREEQIKSELEEYRKERDMDIKFNHNPLNTPNITNHVDWEVLKEKNMFAGHKGNIANQPTTVTRNNHNLLKNNRRLFGI